MMARLPGQAMGPAGRKYARAHYSPSLLYEHHFDGNSRSQVVTMSALASQTCMRLHSGGGERSRFVVLVIVIALSCARESHARATADHRSLQHPGGINHRL